LATKFTNIVCSWWKKEKEVFKAYTYNTFSNCAVSGVAREPGALGQEIFLRPCQQKLQSLK